MDSPVPEWQSPDVLTATELRALRLPQVKGFGRGYDPTAVDQVIDNCASTVESLSLRLVAE